MDEHIYTRFLYPKRCVFAPSNVLHICRTSRLQPIYANCRIPGTVIGRSYIEWAMDQYKKYSIDLHSVDFF